MCSSDLSNTIIVGDFNTSLTPMDRSSKMKTKRNTDLKRHIAQMDLTDIYRAFHTKAAECTFFSSAHGTFSRTDHMVGYKSSCGKFKKTEIISSIFSDHTL